MAIRQEGNTYYGLSTDTKPTGAVLNGREFKEMDTGKKYLFDAENGEWLEQPEEGGGGGGGSSTLSGLADVDISNPTDGQTLVYNATIGKWENGAGGGSLLVTLTMTENQEENQEQKGSVMGDAPTTYTITADKTAGEILTALKAGICVMYTFTDTANNEEYTGPMGPVLYSDDYGYYINLPYGPPDGLSAATADDYPINDKYAP